jgi:sulfatase maturation enzyme AslB (radical SAM superfamily)
MSLRDWFNSDPVRELRKGMLGTQKVSACRRCYVEEDHGGHSRRLRSNQKSVIFTRTAFDQSFEQSPGYKHFSKSHRHQGMTDTVPIDLHVDLGNFCNLACKMCGPRASSTIASQQVRWGIESSRQYLGTDWTRDEPVWEGFKKQLLDLPGLNNIHFMGGETLLTNRLEDLVDTMIEHKRFDLCFSFVTNGTIFRPELLDKLKKFRRVGIEISIETLDEHNVYQRQGTDTQMVLKNIDRYQQWCNGSSITVSLRPAPSSLTIGYYFQVLEYALDNHLVVKSILCTIPRFLCAEILPEAVKQQYQQSFRDLLSKLNDVGTVSDYNASDPNNYRYVIKQQIEMCMSVLGTPTPADSEQELEAMVRHCERWDRVYGYDARKLYPEFQEILQRYGYDISS